MKEPKIYSEPIANKVSFETQEEIALSGGPTFVSVALFQKLGAVHTGNADSSLWD